MLEVMFGAAIGFVLIFSVVRSVGMFGDRAGIVSYQIVEMVYYQSAFTALRSPKAWIATRQRADGFQSGCFPGGGGTCRIMHYFDAGNSTTEAQYFTNAKRWIVPTSGSNGTTGTAFLTIKGSLLYSGDYSCDAEYYNNAAEYRTCMGLNDTNLIEITVTPSDSAIQGAPGYLPPFRLSFFNTKLKHRTNFDVLGAQNHLFINLGFTPGTGWLKDTNECSMNLGENSTSGVSGTCSIAIGGAGGSNFGARAVGDRSVSIGSSIDSNRGALEVNSIAIGRRSRAGAPSSIAIGINSEVAASSGNTVAIGYQSRVLGANNFVIGNDDAEITDENRIQIGGSDQFLHARYDGLDEYTANNPAHTIPHQSSVSSRYFFADRIYSAAFNLGCNPDFSVCTTTLDFIFDYYFDGFVKKEDEDLYHKYKHILPEKNQNSIEYMISFIKENKRLPAFPSKEDVFKNHSLFSINKKLDLILITQEIFSLFLIELYQMDKSYLSSYNSLLENSYIDLENDFLEINMNLEEIRQDIDMGSQKIENLLSTLNVEKN